MHMWNDVYNDRFQEFAPDYLTGTRETALIDLAGINKVPISMLHGTEDWTCSYSRAVATASLIGDELVHLETLEGKDHGYFAGANEPAFMSRLISQLQTWPHVPVGKCLN